MAVLQITALRTLACLHHGQYTRATSIGSSDSSLTGIIYMTALRTPPRTLYRDSRWLESRSAHAAISVLILVKIDTDMPRSPKLVYPLVWSVTSHFAGVCKNPYFLMDTFKSRAFSVSVSHCMSVSLSVSVCQSVCLSVCLSLSLFLSLSLSLSLAVSSSSLRVRQE